MPVDIALMCQIVTKLIERLINKTWRLYKQDLITRGVFYSAGNPAALFVFLITYLQPYNPNISVQNFAKKDSQYTTLRESDFHLRHLPWIQPLMVLRQF
jgi:hypothetical protein